MAAFDYSVIVTGGTVGLGYHTAAKIAKECPNYLVVVASRTDKTNAAATINKTLGQSNTMFLPLDLASPADVRRFAQEWVAAGAERPRIKALVLNAALQFPGPLTFTEEGIEKTFAVAHVGHAMLFHLLCPSLVPTGARVVITASGTHDPAQKTGLADAEYTTAEELARPPLPAGDNSKNGRQRYSTAKLCNVLWAYALARHLGEAAPERRIAVLSMDPGLMPGTNLGREANPILHWLSLHVMPRLVGLLRLLLTPNVHLPEESGGNLARLAVGADVEGVTGKYYEGAKEIKSSVDSYLEKYQEDLWKWTIDYAAAGDKDEMQRFKSFK